jgi:23S rRNA pseudouridine1911/1915/1917 synthase
VRLDLALIRLHPALSRRQAREAIEKGQVDVDGRTVQEAGADVPDSARVRWDQNRKARRRIRASLPLLYADEHFVVVDKPAGLLAVPSGPGREDEDTVLARIRDYARYANPRRPWAAAAHRLDRNTSGAMALALTPQARAGLRALFRAHRIERRYAALVRGTPKAERGQVDAPLAEGYVSGRRHVAPAEEEGRAARTRWRLVERFPQAALLEVELETGLQHQIRIHLAHVGMPVLGDTVYGDAARPSPAPAPRQMLHASLLALAHPITGEPVRVESPLPEDFRKVLSALRRGRAPAPPRRRPSRG